MSRGSQSIFRKANLAIRRAKEANQMANVERYEDLIIGSGIAGKFAAWTRDSRRRTVIVERGLLGGACPNVACLPSKNLIWSAKVISLARRGMEFGLKTDSLSVDMTAAPHRKRRTA